MGNIYDMDKLSGIVREVGELLLLWREQGLATGTFESPHKARSIVDDLANEAIVHGLKKFAPSIPIVSEEDPSSWANTLLPEYWMVDPIDGTASYIQGFDGFVTQVALVIYGVPVMSAVYSPIHKHLYTAKRMCGAFLNDDPIHVNRSAPTSVIDSFPEPIPEIRSLYNKLQLHRYVECGGIGLKICRVADGTADICFKSVVLRNWDTAAPQLILHEAGGVLTDGDGRPIRYNNNYWISGLCATNSHTTLANCIGWHKHYVGSTT